MHFNTPDEALLCSLSREGISDYYSADFVVNGCAYPLLEDDPPPLYVIEPQIKIVAHYNGGLTVTTNQSNALYPNNTSYYEARDTTFWCDGEENPIVGVATGNPDQYLWIYL